MAKKILRFLVSTKSEGILISTKGDLGKLIAWSDAGYAGSDTHSQTGLVVTWGDSIITWRSSRQTVPALSTSEAELYAGTLSWQIVEGLRFLLQEFNFPILVTKLLLDNAAALTIAKCGATWRTRYFAVRAARLHLEYTLGETDLEHCKSKEMIADALTKFSTTDVIHILHMAMGGKITGTILNFGISTTPGRSNRGDNAGDGPSATVAKTILKNESSWRTDRVQLPVPMTTSKRR